MKNHSSFQSLALFALLTLFINTSSSYSQEFIGYRVKKSERTFVVYKINNLNALGEPYVLTDNVFLKLNPDITLFDSAKSYTMITIPGNPRYNKDTIKSNIKTIGGSELGSSFWIPNDYIDRGKINDFFDMEYTQTRLSVSLMTVPFKFRLKSENSNDPSFSTQATIGTCVGYKIIGNSRKNYGLTLGIAGGIMSFDQTLQNAQNPVETEKRTLTGFSVVPSLILNIEDVQMGVVIGWDFIDTNPAWIYNGKPWMSLSVGYVFLKTLQKKEE